MSARRAENRRRARAPARMVRDGSHQAWVVLVYRCLTCLDMSVHSLDGRSVSFLRCAPWVRSYYGSEPARERTRSLEELFHVLVLYRVSCNTLCSRFLHF